LKLGAYRFLIMKKLNLKFVLVALCLLVSVFVFGGCEKYKTVPDPEGTITLSMRNSNNGPVHVNLDDCYPFVINGGNNFLGQGDWKFASIGQVSGLGSVTYIPTSGWANSVAVKTGYGYVGKFTRKQDDITYVRIYVVKEIISSTSGGVMGFEVKYQSPFNP